VALAQKLVAEDRGCLANRIGKLPDFPPVGHQGRGGTIYQWMLRFNCYPHQTALKKGHQAMFDFLYSASDTVIRLLVDCVLPRRAEAEAIASEHPEIVPGLPDLDRELVAKYCWETNTSFEAVKLMLDLGFPVAYPERSHGYTPLHNAAWAGSGDLVELLITRGHPVDIRDPGHDATPLAWALYDCLVEKRHPEGEYVRVVRTLLKAGSPLAGVKYPTGDEAVTRDCTHISKLSLANPTAQSGSPGTLSEPGRMPAALTNGRLARNTLEAGLRRQMSKGEVSGVKADFSTEIGSLTLRRYLRSIDRKGHIYGLRVSLKTMIITVATPNGQESPPSAALAYSGRLCRRSHSPRTERIEVKPPSPPSAQSTQTKKKPPEDLAISA
jgi:hypothetical protein